MRLLHHAPQLDKVPRAGIVHRLDKDTSGLMVVAKTLEAQTDLVRQLQARRVKRHYQALVRGIVERSGTVDAPIGRHPTLRTRMAVVRTGKPARTHYRVLERFVDLHADRMRAGNRADAPDTRAHDVGRASAGR
jgi:23S rRNA pseudouridine1911/1915/1917 synthase